MAVVRLEEDSERSMKRNIAHERVPGNKIAGKSAFIDEAQKLWTANALLKEMYAKRKSLKERYED